jgi:hypothetical protein
MMGFSKYFLLRKAATRLESYRTQNILQCIKIQLFCNVAPYELVSTILVFLDCLTLKLQAKRSPETSVTIYQSTRRNSSQTWLTMKTVTRTSNLTVDFYLDCNFMS